MKDVVGYEDYFQVTEDGQVWSKRTNKFLKQTISKTGYYAISTRLGGRKGIPKYFKVHRFVAQAYIPNPENKPHVNHIDGNKLNNHISNLEWCTPSENIQHAYDTGLINKDSLKGENSFSAKLTNDQVRQIREHFKNHTFKNKSQFCLYYADLYNVCKQNILKIVNNKIFKNV